MAKKAEMKSVAVLDDAGVLIGSTIASEGIDFGDLPTNGTYKYDKDQGHFVPLGHGFGKVKTREPYEPSLVMASLIEAMQKAGIEVPFVATEWLDWYNTELRRRHEEKATRPR